MTRMSRRLPAALPMPDGLMAWTRTQGPDMWHEIACGIDFAEPRATIDLLLAVQWIVRQDRCCRSTALLFLARMVAADLHRAGPPQLAPDAARVMARELHRRLAEGRFAEARFRLSPGQWAMVEAMLGANGPMPLPPATLVCGTNLAHAAFVFLGWHPVAAAPALRLVA
jgi:hypothetical protein